MCVCVDESERVSLSLLLFLLLLFRSKWIFINKMEREVGGWAEGRKLLKRWCLLCDDDDDDEMEKKTQKVKQNLEGKRSISMQ